MSESVSVFEQDKITTYESCRQLAENQARFFDMDEFDYCTVHQNNKVYYKEDKEKFVEDFTNFLVKVQNHDWDYTAWDMGLYLRPKPPVKHISFQSVLTKEGAIFAELVNDVA